MGARWGWGEVRLASGDATPIVNVTRLKVSDPAEPKKQVGSGLIAAIRAVGFVLPRRLALAATISFFPAVNAAQPAEMPKQPGEAAAMRPLERLPVRRVLALAQGQVSARRATQTTRDSTARHEQAESHARPLAAS